jgi:hypothetical protein
MYALTMFLVGELKSTVLSGSQYCSQMALALDWSAEAVLPHAPATSELMEVKTSVERAVFRQMQDCRPERSSAHELIKVCA